MIVARTLLEKFDRWHLLQLRTESFSCFKEIVVENLMALRENKEVLYLLFSRDHC